MRWSLICLSIPRNSLVTSRAFTPGRRERTERREKRKREGRKKRVSMTIAIVAVAGAGVAVVVVQSLGACVTNREREKTEFYRLLCRRFLLF